MTEYENGERIVINASMSFQSELNLISRYDEKLVFRENTEGRCVVLH